MHDSDPTITTYKLGFAYHAVVGRAHSFNDMVTSIHCQPGLSAIISLLESDIKSLISVVLLPSDSDNEEALGLHGAQLDGDEA